MVRYGGAPPIKRIICYTATPQAPGAKWQPPVFPEHGDYGRA